MAFYLKYRPQKLADLDLAEVREGLARALFSKEIPHAFLFAGPRGTGKTSAARIVAKAVNCDVEPCNKCHSCLSITAGTNLDVLEIDGASNRGIDDIRNLREKIKLAPAKLKYKVYIIDEAHMLTGEAFNALLKTLEEPPKHAIFVLCTTEPQKLPQTIISRCLRFNFRKARVDELVAGLSKIVKAEKLKVEKGALEKIARAADGSFRDSQKILEQLSFEKGKIKVEKVNGILGQVRGAGPEKLLEHLVKKDARGAILEIGRVVEKGVNLRWYSERLLERLRLELLAKLGVELDELQGTEKTQNVLKTLKISEIKNLIEIFSRAALELKTTIIPQLPLEMGVVEYCVNSKFQIPNSKKDKVEQVARVEKDLPSNPSKPSLPSGPSSSSLAKRDPAPRDNSSSPSFQDIENKWPQVLNAVGPKNHSVQAFLRATRPKDFDGKTLILEVFYEFHKSQLESVKCRRVVEETAELILKTPVKLRCVLGEKPKPRKLIEKSESDSYRLDLSQEGQKVSQSSDFSDFSDSDIMKVAEEIFGKPVD